MFDDEKDVVLSLSYENGKTETRLNWDVNAPDLLRSFVAMMKAMTFSSSSIVESLREVADEMEEDAEYVVKYKNEED